MDTDDALSVLRDYLRAVRLTAAYPLDDLGYITPAGDWTAERSPAADVARTWARELLAAAEADGACGCLLCKS